LNFLWLMNCVLRTDKRYYNHFSLIVNSKYSIFPFIFFAGAKKPL